jgi:hypothetical protein
MMRERFRRMWRADGGFTIVGLTLVLGVLGAAALAVALL